MAGRSLGSPRGAHPRASLVVDLYSLHRHGSGYIARQPLRGCRRADARAVFAGDGRSCGATCLQSRRQQLVTDQQARPRHRNRDRRHRTWFCHDSAYCRLGDGELGMADRVLSREPARNRDGSPLVAPVTQPSA